jgi:hypothetical protein
VRDVIKSLAEVRETTVEAITGTVHTNLLQLLQADPRLTDTYARVLEANS